MIKEIYLKIKEEESTLFFLGWLAIAFFFSWGNTSLGILLILLHTIYVGFKKHKIPLYYPSQVSSLFLIFIGWAFLTSITAYNISIALLSTTGFALMIYLAYFGSGNLIAHKEFLLKLMLPVAVTGISISSLITILRYFYQDIHRSHTFFVHYNGTGTLMVISLSIIIGYFEFIKNRKKYILLIPVLLSILALLLTYSRGALLGFFAAFTFYNMKSKKHIIILLIIMILVISIIFSFPKLRSRFLSIFSLESNKIRIQIWQSTINMIKDHPVKGIGPGNFPLLYPDYRMPDENRSFTFSFSHNIFSNVAAETGVVGLILYLGITLYLFKMGFYISKINPLYRGLFSAFIGVMVREQVDCTILGLEIGAVFWIVAGLIAVIYLKNKEEQK